MSFYRTIDRGIWGDERIQSCSAIARAVFAYLCVNEHDDVSGIYRLPLSYIEDDTGWDREQIRAALAELARERLAYYDGRARVVWVVNMLRKQGREKVSSKILQHVERQLNGLPTTDLKREMVAHYAKIGIPIGYPMGHLRVNGSDADYPIREQESEDLDRVPSVSGRVSSGYPPSLDSDSDLDRSSSSSEQPARAREAEKPRVIVHREPSDEITPGQHVWLAELQDRLTNGWEGRPPPNPRGRGRLVLRASQGLELARSSVTIDEVCEVVWGLAEMIEAGQADTNDWRGVYVFSGHFEGVRDRVKTWREKQARRKRETEPESAPSDPCLTEDVIARQIAQSEVLRGR